jgi:hypothetical protein
VTLKIITLPGIFLNTIHEPNTVGFLNVIFGEIYRQLH